MGMANETIETWQGKVRNRHTNEMGLRKGDDIEGKDISQRKMRHGRGR